MIYGPYQKETARFLHSIYIDSSIIGTKNQESIKNHIEFYLMYL